jgi:hypothetical protein
VLGTGEVGKYRRLAVAAIVRVAAGSPFNYVPFSTVFSVALMVERPDAEE